MIEAKVVGLAMDVQSNTPVVLLSPANSDTERLPIWIGFFEAWTISTEMMGVRSRRPLTHSLLIEVIEQMGGKISKIEIHELREEIYYAKIQIVQGGKALEIDARPSDCIILALKLKIPIWVNPDLFHHVEKLRAEGKATQPIDHETLKERLSNTAPKDFGTFRM